MISMADQKLSDMMPLSARELEACRDFLETRLEALSTSKAQSAKISFETNIPFVSKKIELDCEVSLFWVEGTRGIASVRAPSEYGSSIDITGITDELNKQYNAAIKQLCDEVDEFKKCGGQWMYW